MLPQPQNRTAPSAPPILDYSPPRKQPSPILRWGLMLLIAFILQMFFLPCLCNDSIVKMRFAFCVDLLFVLRAAFAILRKEQGYAWLIYGLILVTSCIWIEQLVALTAPIFYKP